MALDTTALLSALGGTAGGAVTTVLIFRARQDVSDTKLARVEKDLERLEELIAELRKECEQWRRDGSTRVHGSARREEFMLELLLGIAAKHGVTHRFSDVLVRLQSGDETNPVGGT